MFLALQLILTLFWFVLTNPEFAFSHSQKQTNKSDANLPTKWQTFQKIDSNATRIKLLDSKSDSFTIELKSQKYYDLSSKIQFLKDENNTILIQNLLQNPKQYQFQPVNQHSNNFGYTNAAYWVRFALQNSPSGPVQPPKEWWLEISPPWINKIDLYLITRDKIKRIQAGTAFAQATRPIEHTNFILPLQVKHNEKTWIYAKLQSYSMQIHFHLWSPQSFFQTNHKRQIIIGAYFGVLFIMFVFNFMLFFIVREKSYLFYAGYIFFAILFQATIHGYSFEFLWPNAIDIGISVSNAIAGIVYIFTILFATSFLQTKDFLPRAHKWLLRYQVFPALCSILFFFPSIRTDVLYAPACALIGTIIVFFVIWTAILSYRQGYKPARFFIAGWSILAISVIAFVFKQYGLLPNNAITVYAVYFGTAIEITLLSFAMGDRMHYWKNEREKAQKFLLKTQKMITESLEKKVAQRTMELKKSEQRFRVFADSTFESLAIIDHKFRILDCNKALEEISGFDKNQIIGQPAMRFVAPQYQSIVRDNILNQYENPYEVRLLDIHGQQIPVEVLGKTIQYQGENVRITAMRDIRERKNMEQLKETVDHIIRHDIKSPLTGILGFAELLTNSSTPAEKEKYLSFIRQGVQKISSILNSQSDIQQMELGTYQLQKDSFDVMTVFKNIEDEMIKIRVKTKSDIQFFLNNQHWNGKDPYNIIGEKNKLTQLFSNLIKNALEASPHNVPVKVFISQEAPNQYTNNGTNHIIEIHNQGVIPASIKDSFFNRYVTQGKPKGVGLGTYSALLIARAHGGDISFTTSEREGTSLIVKLPIHYT